MQLETGVLKTEILFQDTLPSTIYNNEMSAYLKEYAEQKQFPVGRVKFKKSMEGYVGFNVDYYIIAKRLPPIPGGWEVKVEKFAAKHSKVFIAVTMGDDNIPVPTHKYVLQIIEEFKKDGLIIEPTDEYENVYGAQGRYYSVHGHPRLIDEFEEVIEEMR